MRQARISGATYVQCSWPDDTQFPNLIGAVPQFVRPGYFQEHRCKFGAEYLLRKKTTAIFLDQLDH
jgi:hypothetical protein